jgi:hypothetical protein
VHPAPLPGEALSSWLWRIADRYDADLGVLTSDMGHALAEPEELDTCPPVGFARKLASRTGVDVNRIRRMSLSGWAPWLLDQMEPGPDAFTTYTRQLSVLLPAGRRRPREAPGWRAWLPAKQTLRACPRCVATTKQPHPYQLMWSLPLMLSCPFHGCLLEPHTDVPGYYLGWEYAPPQPRPAAAPVVAMDRRTWDAMTTGSVQLPRRQVHAGIWFRLIRTIIDELATTASECGAPGRLIRHIWEAIGYPDRAGQSFWRTHESSPLSVQLRTLEAAATAIDLLESKTLTGRGLNAMLFLPMPSAPVYDGDAPDRNSIAYLWARACSAFDEAVVEARGDPDTAKAVFDMMLYGRKSATAIQGVLSDLQDLGVPLHYLSHKEQ